MNTDKSTTADTQKPADDASMVALVYTDGLLVRFMVMQLVHHGIQFMVRPVQEKPAGAVVVPSVLEAVIPDYWEIIFAKEHLLFVKAIFEKKYVRG